MSISKTKLADEVLFLAKLIGWGATDGPDFNQ